MVGIAFDVDNLRDGVLGLVAERVDDDAAAHRTIRTGATCLAGSGNFERLGLGVNRSQIKAEGGETGSAKHGAFEKSPARELHLVAPVLRIPESYGGEVLLTLTTAPDLVPC